MGHGEASALQWKTVRRNTPVILDLLSEILIEVGLMDRPNTIQRKACQEGKSTQSTQVTVKLDNKNSQECPPSP